ncbi:lipopolysaccharide biosynthesis protein [Moritella viscosa]|uniref:lipopolysaccharide biosynthesis protein n=1 Tax=Moritella viscosa TaxID=80854 RepID=UPI000910469C|nr:lipopolysaccharide biosynthesis protein [Moritella viscosa]SGY94182.1 Putative O-antigen flippase [Moritella viscosa]
MDKSFLKSFLVYGGSAGISRVLPILMLPLYLTSLGSEAYGKVEVVFAFFTFILIFGLLQLETALQRMYFTVEDRAGLFYSLLIVIIFLSISIAIIVTALSSSISFFLFDSESESDAIIIASISVVFANIATICMVFLRYKDKPKEFAFLTIGQVIITSLVTYFSLITLQVGSVGYFYGILSGWFFVATCSFCILSYSIKFSWNIGYIKQSFKFAMPQFPARLASFFVQFGNRFVVLYILGAQSVALMSLSLKFAAFFQLLMLAFSMAWNPFLYKNENMDGLEEKVNSLFKVLLATLSLMHIITILLSSVILSTFFDNEYHEASKYVVLAIIPVQLLIIKEVVESGVRLANKTKYISYSYFLSVTVTVVLMFFSKTIEQVLIATIVGTLVLVLFSWYYSEKYYRIRYSKISFIMYVLIILISLASLLII